MTKDEALRLALDALTGPGYYDTYQQRQAIAAIKQVMGQPEPGPVALAWHLDVETVRFLVEMINAGDEPTEIVLRVGYIQDDDGNVKHGLLVEDAEYPEEGASLLVECAPISISPPKREPLTDEQIEKKFEKFSAQYDTLGNEWQDMGANDYFRAGFKAAYDTKGKHDLP